MTNAINGTPGLAEVPGAGWIAKNESLQNAETELLILVTPRMVRLAPRKDHAIYAGQGALEGPAGAAPLREERRIVQPTLPVPVPPTAPVQPPSAPQQQAPQTQQQPGQPPAGQRPE